MIEINLVLMDVTLQSYMALKGAAAREAIDAQLTDLKRQSRELMSRLSGLFGATGRWVGRPTAEQQSEFKFYQDMVVKLTQAAAGM